MDWSSSTGCFPFILPNGRTICDAFASRMLIVNRFISFRVYQDIAESKISKNSRGADDFQWTTKHQWSAAECHGSGCNPIFRLNVVCYLQMIIATESITNDSDCMEQIETFASQQEVNWSASFRRGDCVGIAVRCLDFTRSIETKWRRSVNIDRQGQWWNSRVGVH